MKYQTASNVLINYIKPYIESGEAVYEDFFSEDGHKQKMLAWVIELKEIGKMSGLEVKKWIKERCGESELEKCLFEKGFSTAMMRDMDMVELNNYAKR